MRRSLLAMFCGFVLPAGLAASHAAVESPATLSLAGGVVLHGTLAQPAHAEHPPVMLLIAGSGPTDRDGDNRLLPGRNQALRLLAEGLADAGIASVRYDKRGVGASAAAAPDESALRFDSYVDDAAAWLRQLQADARFSAVGVIGHSEGALIGTLAAHWTHVLAVVSVAGPARRASDVLRGQLAGQLSPALAAENDAILDALEHGRLVPGVPGALATLYRDSVQPYLVSWFRYVPTREFAALQVPALVVQGDTDIQVDLADAQALAGTCSRARLLVVPGMNHVLKAVPADAALQTRSYSDPALPLADGLVPPLAAFIHGAMASAR